MPTLLFFYPEKQKRWKMEIDRSRFIVGRSREVEVCIPHASVSKQHVVIEKKGSRYLYRDLGSKNGVYLNDFRRDHGPLDDGDELRIGSIVVTFYAGRPADLPAAGAPTERPSGLELQTREELLATTETVAVPLKALQPRSGEVETGPVPTPVFPAESPAVAGAPSAAPPASRRESVAKGTPGGVPPADDPAPAAAADGLSGPAPPPRPGVRRPAGIRPRIPVDEKLAAGGPRMWSGKSLLLVGTGCLIAGVVLGYLGSLLDSGDATPAAPQAARSASETRAVESPPAAATATAPAETAGPLGPVASLADPETAARLCVRLYMDLVGRPPLRQELRELVQLSHEKIWDKVTSRAPPELQSAAQTLPETFERLMGRKPSDAELKSVLEKAKGDHDHFTFLVAMSRDYAAASHRKKRQDKLLARSLLVDLMDSVPSAAQEAKSLEAVRLAKGEIGRVAKALMESPGSSKAAPGGGESAESWVKEAYSRFLLRFPAEDELAKAIQQLKNEKDGWRAVLLDLAGRAEYLAY